MSDKIKTDVVIVGAGISGLATAHFLSSNGYQTHILEKNKWAGGTIRSQRVDGFLVEYGPNSVLDTTPLLHQLFDAIGIENQMEYANHRAKNRYIVRDGRLNPVPMNPFSFLATPLLSTESKLRLLKEPFISPSSLEAEESLAEFVKRRLGQEFLDCAINPFVAGVYAGIPEKLSVRSGFPKLHQLEQTYGSLIKGAIGGARKRRKNKETSKQRAQLFSFQNGMQTIIDALAREFSDTIFTNTAIDSIRRKQSGFEVDLRTNDNLLQIVCNALLLAIPSYGYKELKFEFEFPIRRQLNQIEYPPVAMVFFGYQTNPARVPLDGFGFLVPEKENRSILGTIWNSTIFSNRAIPGGAALTTFVGGSRQPEMALENEEQIIKRVAKDLQDIMGITRRPDIVVIHRWDRAIPQYHLGHQSIINAIEELEKAVPGLYISGNFRGGISVGDCVKQAFVMSERISSELKTPTSPLTYVQVRA